MLIFWPNFVHLVGLATAHHPFWGRKIKDRGHKMSKLLLACREFISRARATNFLCVSETDVGEADQGVLYLY